jgi:DNA-binding response OmpR family regulator
MSNTIRYGTTLAVARELPRQPSAQTATRRPSLLIASRFDDDLISLIETVRAADWTVYWCGNCADAIRKIQVERVPVILADRELCDSDWRTLLGRVQSLVNPPRFVLTARHADEKLWTEALNLGAHDLISKPFDCAEVIRIINWAERFWTAANKGKPL